MTKVSQQKQTILVIFCKCMGLLRKYFQLLATFSQNLTLQETFETVVLVNEELKQTEFDGPF